MADPQRIKVILAWTNIVFYSLLTLAIFIFLFLKVSKVTDRTFMLTMSILLLLAYSFQFWRSQQFLQMVDGGIDPDIYHDAFTTMVIENTFFHLDYLVHSLFVI